MGNIKTVFKGFVGKSFSCFDYPILVNSYGRSGSTILKRSIAESSIKLEKEKVRDLAFRLISLKAWYLENNKLLNGIIYKTHDYPPSCYSNKNLRMLYTFAGPVDVVLSLNRLYELQGEQWMKKHYEHLGLSYTNSFDKIFYEDQLQLEKHLDSWLNETRIPIAFIKYESMWDHQDDISEFLGFQVDLPEFKERKASQSKDIDKTETINETYEQLIEKINNLDDFFINLGSNNK